MDLKKIIYILEGNRMKIDHTAACNQYINRFEIISPQVRKVH